MFSTYFWQDINHSYETDLEFLAIYYRQDAGDADNYLRQELAVNYVKYRL